MNKPKILLFTMALFMLGYSSFAQDDNGVRIGVKGGVNFSNFRIDDVEDNNLKAGLNLGLFAKLPVSDAFALQPEILYSSKGAKLSYNNLLLGSGEYRFNLNYIEVPVLGVVTIGDAFNIHFGPYIGFLTSANVKDLDDDGNVSTIADLKEDNFKRVDYGLAAGLGFDFNGFTIGARYNYGLNEVGKSGSLSGEALRNTKNSVGTIYIGFGF